MIQSIQDKPSSIKVQTAVNLFVLITKILPELFASLFNIFFIKFDFAIICLRHTLTYTLTSSSIFAISLVCAVYIFTDQVVRMT